MMKVVETSFENKEVTIQSDYPISGTLTIPKSNTSSMPAILLMAGSGKSDRNGNLNNMEMNIYKDLADFFTSLGFVTLRYDKRGTYKSGGSFLEAGLSDFITDAVACVKFLKEFPLVNKEKIIIVGHSEGAILAPAVYAQANVSGLILLAGVAAPSMEILPLQNEMAYKELNESKGVKGWLIRTFNVVERARQKNEKIFQKIAESNDPVMRIQGVKMNAKWLRETMSYNVCEYLKEVKCPVLSITGDRDVQTPPEQAKLIAEMVPGEAEWYIIPGMNHIFRKYEGQHTILNLMKEYKSQIGQPIDKDLLAIIEKWLKKYF